MKDATEVKAGNVLVSADGIRRIHELQTEFKTRTNGGRITQTTLADLGLKKLTISDLLPSAQLAAV